MQSSYIPWKAWYGDEEFKLNFPDKWMVNYFPISDVPVITKEEVEKSLSSPIGSAPLPLIAKGKKNGVILVDDLSRPTPAYKVIPLVIEGLKKAGLKESNIQIIIALGAHRPLLKNDIIKKMGKKIANSFEICNHNPYENLINIGTSSKGTPIFLNKMYMSSDIRIGIGCVMPHGYVGFSGGGKIIIPGISGINTIEAIHLFAGKRLKKISNFKNNNGVRSEINEISKKSNLNFIVNVIVNSRRDIIKIFAGDAIKAHNESIKFAKEIYSIKGLLSKLDIIIFNSYPKDTDLIQAINALNPLLNTKREIIKESGYIIITTASTEGEGYHSLGGHGMRLFQYNDNFPWVKKIIKGKKLIIFSPNLSNNEVYKYYTDSVLYFNNWDFLINEIRKKYNRGCNVGIFPCAPLQIISK